MPGSIMRRPPGSLPVPGHSFRKQLLCRLLKLLLSLLFSLENLLYRLILDWAICQQNSPGIKWLSFYELKLGATLFSEKTFSFSWHNRADKEAKFVNEIVVQQRLYEYAAAWYENIFSRLLLQPGYFFYDVLFNHVRIIPRQFSIICRNDVLGDAVHAVGKISRPRRPALRKNCIGHLSD